MSHYGDVGRSFLVFIGVSIISVKVMWLPIKMPRRRRTFTKLRTLQKVYIKVLTLDKKAFISSKKKINPLKLLTSVDINADTTTAALKQPNSLTAF